MKENKMDIGFLFIILFCAPGFIFILEIITIGLMSNDLKKLSGKNDYEILEILDKRNFNIRFWKFLKKHREFYKKSMKRKLLLLFLIIQIISFLLLINIIIKK